MAVDTPDGSYYHARYCHPSSRRFLNEDLSPLAMEKKHETGG